MLHKNSILFSIIEKTASNIHKNENNKFLKSYQDISVFNETKNYQDI
jgi:hypothetical protein